MNRERDVALESSRVVVDHLTVEDERSHGEIIQDISLSVLAGQILGVVGESGSGKTTLGLAMLRHTRRGLRISNGSVLVDGQDLGTISPDELRRLRGRSLAYVPQDPGAALNPARRVGPQLLEALTTHGYKKQAARSRVTDLLTEVGLAASASVLTSYPHQLSGGQQQRVTIALAFACRPGLIVLDEPTTGLDVTTQRTVLNTVKDLCSRYGVAAIYVSHDVLVVGGLADRIAVVYAGRVVEIGATADVLRSPQHPYTRGLLRAVPSPDRSAPLLGMEGVPPRPGQRPPGCAFAPRCPVSIDRCEAERPRLYAAGSGGHSARCFLIEDAQDGSRRATAEPTPSGRTSAARDRAAGTADVGTDAVLRIDNLTASHGSRQVLHGVSLAVSPNACIAIVGESGSGKTTLAQCLVGLHTAWSGDIVYQGIPLAPEVRGRPREALREIQYVFQNPYASLNPRRTIGGVLAQPLEHFVKPGRRDRDRRIVQAIESVSLPADILDRYPDQLSGGERQRVAIARALIVEPRVLICDEVTSALDVSVQAAVVEMLRRLQYDRGLALVFITHNLALVRSIAQQVVVMSAGTVVETGPTDSVLDNPQGEYTQRLLQDVPKLGDIGAGVPLSGLP